MKVNGTQVDDLIGTGLFSKQRYVIPAWLIALGLVLGFFARTIGRLLVWAVRHPLMTLALCWLAIAWARFGVRGVIALVLGAVWGLAAWWAVRPESFSRLVVQRSRGLWRWWICYRPRWHPAMDGTGLTKTSPDRVVYVPTVTRVTSTPVVDTLHVRLLHGHTPTDLALQAEGLRHVFGAYRCKVVEDAPGRVRVVFYARDPLTATVPSIPAPDVVDLAGLHVGRAEDGEVYRLRLKGAHVLIIGATGAGKGSALWSPIKAMAPAVHAGLIELNGIDPKRMELVFAPKLFTRLEAKSLSGMVDLLETQVARMQERQDRLSGITRDHVPTLADPTVVTVIDELASLTAYCTERDLKKRVEAALSLLLSQGRAVGFHVLAAGQDPRKEIVQFRDLFPTRIALRTTEASHVDMILGDGAQDAGATCHLIPDTMPGVGFVRVEGVREPVRVRFAYVSDGDLREMNETWPAPCHQNRVIDLRQAREIGAFPNGHQVPSQRPVPRAERAEGGDPA